MIELFLALYEYVKDVYVCFYYDFKTALIAIKHPDFLEETLKGNYCELNESDICEFVNWEDHILYITSIQFANDLFLFKMELLLNKIKKNILN